MHVKLPDDVAERADIDLFGAGRLLQARRHQIGLEGQHRLVERSQFEDLLYVGALGYEDQPRPAPIVHQPHLAQPERADRDAVALKSLVKREGRQEILLGIKRIRFVLHIDTSFLKAWLAFAADIADMKAGRLVVDEPLANRVRSGRKQP